MSPLEIAQALGYFVQNTGDVTPGAPVTFGDKAWIFTFGVAAGIAAYSGYIVIQHHPRRAPRAKQQ